MIQITAMYALAYSIDPGVLRGECVHKAPITEDVRRRGGRPMRAVGQPRSRDEQRQRHCNSFGFG